MASWKDIELAAQRCPALYEAVERVARGELTREQALIIAALDLAQQQERVISEKAAMRRDLPKLEDLDAALAALERVRRGLR